MRVFILFTIQTYFETQSIFSDGIAQGAWRMNIFLGDENPEENPSKRRKSTKFCENLEKMLLFLKITPSIERCVKSQIKNEMEFCFKNGKKKIGQKLIKKPVII